MTARLNMLLYAMLLTAHQYHAIASKIRLYPSGEQSLHNRLNKRSHTNMEGGPTLCYKIKVNVENTTLMVDLDTGSADLIIPLKGLNDYSGPTVNRVFDPSQRKTKIEYMDNSAGQGYGFIGSVSLTRTSVFSSDAPIVGIAEQSIDSPLIGRYKDQGLLGLAYASAANYKPKQGTVLDAWHNSGTMAKNQFAFHACPYDKIDQSYIDFGNSEPVSKCGSSTEPNVWTKSPSTSLITMKLSAIYIDDTSIELPRMFQSGVKIEDWAVIDTCTTVMTLPKNIVLALQEKIRSSGGLPSGLTLEKSNDLLSGNMALSSNNLFNWDKLPKLTFEARSDETNSGSVVSTFNITLSARQYFRANSKGDTEFAISIGSDEAALLGTPFLTNLRIVVDRDRFRVGFSLGCGCETSPDGYPTIKTSNGKIWSSGSA
ncbi:hypothetical protein BASA83_012904 [Batrachochytrium salamandrivorans]|nr:hypothetical protein BASA62_008230 [Batrachochytrium salamandrivorans]KAH9263693.1 hypothetical protein BASA83_012904 [Batrachochytrium salamandrivorans]